MPVIQCWVVEKEEQELKAILCYLESSRGQPGLHKTLKNKEEMLEEAADP